MLEELQCGSVVQEVPGAALRRRVRAVERGQQADRFEGAPEDAGESERTQEAGEQRLRLNLCSQIKLEKVEKHTYSTVIIVLNL